ncbi:MAG: hypothetical protein CMJ40_06620 [Phycisphaerae bacterium]|nr:hypothetical protein [Phycisphaerae bacterium]
MPQGCEQIKRPSGTELSVIRLGVVSYLNTRPIIRGLEAREDIELRQAVPSQLLDQVVDGKVEVGMCSSIDYLRSPIPLKLLRVAPLTCNGETLTVRIFSSVPIEEITRIHCDTDSHTSVALLSILMKEAWGIDSEIIDFDASVRSEPWPDTVMLIGDKVVNGPPSSETHPVQIDLGEVWKQLTGLPFVFALWMTRSDACETMLAHVFHSLRDNLDRNLRSIEEFIEEEARLHDWPLDLASRYLNGLIRYELGPSELAGLKKFHELAVKHGLVDAGRPLELYEG